MRIQHNISALNSWGKLGINQNNAAKNLEKLSSGYRINRAGDDAAGLAISEKMRGQIRGLNMASKNAQDGISLIQTAEGALDETHSILQRMRELAVQSANGTYQDEDRANTDLEVQALKDELDRIANSTHFNKIQLLDGSLSAGGTKGTAGKAAAKVSVSDAAMSTGAFNVKAAVAGEYRTTESLTGIQDGATNSYTFTYADEKGNIQTETIKMSYNANDGKIVDAKGETLAQATGSTAGADVTAQALKAALEKTDFGKNFKIDVVNKDGKTAEEAMADPAYATAKGDVDTAQQAVDSAQADIDQDIADGNDPTTAHQTALTTAQGNLATAQAALDAVSVTANNATIKLTAKEAGTSTVVLKGFIQDTTGVESRATATGSAGADNFDLDFSKVDITKLKAGDHLKIGEGAGVLDITFANNADPLTTDKTNTGGTTIYLDNIKSTNDLAAAVAECITKGTKPNFIVTGSDTGAAEEAATTAAAASGSKVNITLNKKLGSNTNSLDTDLKRIINKVEYTDSSVTGPNNTTDNGLIGRASGAVAGYTLTSDKAAADRYESYDMTKVGVWDGSNPADKIEDKVFTVDGQRFLFVKEDSMLSNTNMMKALEHYGNDVNVVITNGNNGTAPTEEDIVEMANRIKEKTGTNVVANDKFLEFHSTKGTNGSSSDGKLVFQIGANGSADQRVSMSIDDMSAKGIGVAGVDITTVDSANKAIDIIDNAINTVSATRANLGAMQNRLEHTINSLNTSSENLTAAESRIRDVDMAKEMMEFTKNNILTQAAQAMLAQANQQPQGVLQLLQ